MLPHLAAAHCETLEPRTLLTAASFHVQGPGIYPEDFTASIFAQGLNYPLGMAQLSDGSILAATSKPTDANGYFGASVGQLVRLYDLNGDGVADGSQVLADNLPRELTDISIAGNLVFVVSAGSAGNGVDPTITILALGRRVYSPLTKLATLSFAYPSPWQHYTYAVTSRPTPGKAGSYDIFFNVGSQDDGDTTPADLTTTLTSSDGLFTGALHPDSIYKLTITPGIRDRLAFSNLTEIAYGLRNAAGIEIQPGTGDLYFEDNGINGGSNGDGDPQLSADELNMIPYSQIGVGTPPDFGFAHDYISEPSGARVGSGGVQPLVAYTPVDGSYSEGPQDIAFTPSTWPAGFNDGVVAGFYGQSEYTGNGLVNTQNPVVYYGLNTQAKFDLIGNDVAAIGHPTGLLSSANSLYVADLSPDNIFSPNSGIIYKLTPNPSLYTVSGIAYTDNNDDGGFDAGDTVQRYQTIYIDENGNGVYDPGTDRVAVTDRHGMYHFTLPTGRWQLQQVLPDGFTSTSPDPLVVRLGTARGYLQSAPNRNFGSQG